MAKNYWEKLQDPRWQKKRLEVMQEAGFECSRCGSTENTLNVHHKEYLKGHEPWEYDLEQLVCLCKDCHELMHDSNYALRYVISNLPIDFSYDSIDVVFIIGGAIRLPYEKLLKLTESEDCSYFKSRYMAGENLHELICYFNEQLKNGESK